MQLLGQIKKQHQLDNTDKYRANIFTASNSELQKRLLFEQTANALKSSAQSFQAHHTNSTPLHSTHSTLLYSTLLYSTLLYSTLLYSTLLLHYVAQGCTGDAFSYSRISVPKCNGVWFGKTALKIDLYIHCL